MATFGEFAVGRLGMMASQYALNVTGQNITNINTHGYTRQRLDQYSFITKGAGLYHGAGVINIGSGVMMAGVSQLRDPFLDIRFRKEMSSVGSAGATLDGLGQLESVLNDVDKNGITTQLQDLLKKLQDLNTEHTGEQEFDTLVRSSAEALCQLLNISSKNLQTVYDNVLTQYKQNVQETDTILKKIQDLNEEIRRADINGDPALELRDQRNMLIDDLSEYAKIDVTYSDEDVGAGVTVEKLTIKLVNNKTNKPDKTLIDGIYRADVDIKHEVDANGKIIYDPALRLEIGELHDSEYKTEISNTTSQFEIDGFKFGENATDGKQKIDIDYTDKDGNPQKVTVEFDVTKPQITPPATKPTAKQTAEAREKTLKSLADAINKNPKMSAVFKATSGPGGLTISSLEKGKEAATIGKVELQNQGHDVQLGPTKNKPAVPSNKGPIEEGEGYGALESTRRMLVGEGEFRTDGGDVAIRGIPYYQKSLDALANKVAAEMNRINTTRPDGSAFNAVGPNGEIAQMQSGNLFTAEGDDTNNPTTLITAGNISISSGWKNGSVHVVSSISGKPEQSTLNDNTNRFIDVFDKPQIFRPTDIIRTDDAKFTTGEPKQDPKLTAGTDLTAKITYIDSLNRQHTVTVKYKAGATADLTQDNLFNAISNDPELKAIFDVKDDGNTITLDDKNVNTDGKLCNLVTDITIGNDKGELTNDFKLENGKTSGTVQGDPFYKGKLEGHYANMQGVLGSNKSQIGANYETYIAAADQINTSRDSVSGVDLNEEGTNLMQYQKSFAAACRVMTALDEAMDKVINGMGVVGR